MEEVTYFVQEDRAGRVVLLFRVRRDMMARKLWMERLEPGGGWERDFSLIEEVHEPGTREVDERTAAWLEGEWVARTLDRGVGSPVAGASGTD